MTISSSIHPHTPHHGLFANPILPGGYPDPSICRVGDDYYLVNSSFEYFPGLPIHHSRDLVNWTLVGYGLQRLEQCARGLDLADVQSQGGIHAPTLRHHAGTFYLISTNVYQPQDQTQPTQFVNFILTASDVRGPWSAPHILAGAPGIDPDIFFDDDGKVWIAGAHPPEQPNFPGEGEIWLQELDLQNWVLTGDRFYLYRGACGGVWVEGPHLYKKNGVYYLLVAEGGTGFNHAVMVAASQQIQGPFHSNPRNPILTSRHLSHDNWVHSTGHADLVELPDGRWYMVALGVRGDVERISNMGRETHLIPLVWEQGASVSQGIPAEWPVCAPQTGRVERLTPLPFPEVGQKAASPFCEHFESETLSLAWNTRRLPLPGSFSVQAQPARLRLLAGAGHIQERGQYSFIGFRQQQSNFEFQLALEFNPISAGLEAGLLLLQRDDNYLKFSLIRQNDQNLLSLMLSEFNRPNQLLHQQPVEEYPGRILLRVVSQAQRYRFDYRLQQASSWLPFSETGANLLLSRGYTGAYLGLYASSNGYPSTTYADFSALQYQDLTD